MAAGLTGADAPAAGCAAGAFFSPRAAFAGQRRAEFEQALKIPQTHDFVVAIAIGVPAMSKEAHEVFPGKVDFVR